MTLLGTCSLCARRLWHNKIQGRAVCSFCPKCDRIPCPRCGKPELSGRRVTCPDCGARMSAHVPTESR